MDALTEHHQPLTERLLAMLNSGQVSSIEDLAAIDLADWKRLVADTGGAPSGTQGDSRDRRTEKYARKLARRVAQAFPTRALGARLQVGDHTVDSRVADFLASNPDFDLQCDDVLTFLAAKSPSDEDAEAVSDELQSVQRVCRISPSTDAAVTLLSAGFRSSYDIVRMPHDVFVQQFGKDLGPADAEMTYEAARVAIVADTDDDDDDEDDDE